MSFSSTPAVASGPFSACGTIAKIDAVTKAKKAGGTFTVNIVTLNTGVEIDFGFKPAFGKVGDTVEWSVMKKYGKYEFAAPTAAPGLPAAFPARGAAVAPSTLTPPAVTPGPAAFYGGKPFPLPQTHGDTAIIRQNALTNANKIVDDWYSGNPENDRGTVEQYTDLIIKSAYKLAAFSSGNLDAEVVAEVATRKASSRKAAAVGSLGSIMAAAGTHSDHDE